MRAFRIFPEFKIQGLTFYGKSDGMDGWTFHPDVCVCVCGGGGWGGVGGSMYKRITSRVLSPVNKMRESTVVLTKSDSDVIVCIQLLSETFTCTLHLS